MLQRRVHCEPDFLSMAWRQPTGSAEVGLGKCRPRCWTTNAAERRVIALRPPDGVRQDLAAHLVTICAVLQNRLGRDFSQYKPGTLMRRIQRRMQVLQTDEVPSYIDLKIIVMDPYRVRTGCNHALHRRVRGLRPPPRSVEHGGSDVGKFSQHPLTLIDPWMAS